MTSIEQAHIPQDRFDLGGLLSKLRRREEKPTHKTPPETRSEKPLHPGSVKRFIECIGYPLAFQIEAFNQLDIHTLEDGEFFAERLSLHLFNTLWPSYDFDDICRLTDEWEQIDGVPLQNYFHERRDINVVSREDSPETKDYKRSLDYAARETVRIVIEDAKRQTNQKDKLKKLRRNIIDRFYASYHRRNTLPLYTPTSEANEQFAWSYPRRKREIMLYRQRAQQIDSTSA